MHSNIIHNYQALNKHIQELLNSYNLNYPIKIIAVSKTFSIKDILTIYSCGQLDFAENYIQELINKARELASYKDINWHFIGKLQSNKLKQISNVVNWIHSLEKIKHAEILNNNRSDQLPKLNILIEVNISQNPNKHGLVTFDEIIELAKIIKELPKLQLKGLMGIASNTSNNTLIYQQFNYLKSVYDKLNSYGLRLDTLSMGMSNDYPIAIECGANMLRIGSKIFGKRSYAK